MISNRLFIVYLTTGSICWVLYLIILVQMIRPRPTRDFVSSFFVIAKVLAVVDLCGYIAYTVMFKMPLTPMFSFYFGKLEPTYFFSGPYFVPTYLDFVHTMLVMLTAANRWTALVFPAKHEKIWKKVTKPAIWVSFLFPICLCFQRLLTPTYITPFTINATDSFAFRSVELDWFPDEINALLFALLYIVIGAITVMLNISSWISLSLVKQTAQNNLHQQNLWQSIQRSEIGLIIVCFGDLIAMLGMIVIHVILYDLGARDLWWDPLYDLMYLQIPWVSDLGRFIRPFMLLFMIYFSYGSVCWTLYLIILIQMMSPRQSNDFVSSFFIIAKVLAVVDLCGYIGYTIMFKMPLTPFFASYFKNIESSYAWSIPYVGPIYLDFVHTMLVMVTALNRWTALVFPAKHEKIWKKLIRPMIWLSFLVPICILFPRLTVATYLMPFEMNGSDSFVFRGEEIEWFPDSLNALLFALFYIVIGVITVMLNVSSWISLSLVKQTARSNLNQKNLWQSIQRTEIGLILVCFGDLIAMMLMIVIQITLYYLGVRELYYDPLYDFMYLQIPWVSDLGRFIRPFMLLFMSKTVRDAFLSTFPYYTNSKSAMSTTVIRTNDSSLFVRAPVFHS